jgi:hypothetical protein
MRIASLVAICLAAASSVGAQGTAGIAGTLRDRTSLQPLAGAAVSVLATTFSVRTDTAGRFSGSGLKGGVYVMQVRAIGYGPGSWIIELAEGETLSILIEMESAITLQGVTVEAPSWQQRGLAGFEERRQRGRGVYLTEASIGKTNPARLADILRSVPGIRLICRYSGCRIRMARSECQPDFFLNGLPANNSTSLDMSPLGIVGIEIYRTITETPMDFLRGNNTCGTIAIWTRTGP